MTSMKSEDPPRRVKLLPDHLINRIAAGEVVERPATVLKELVENSLDAGADRVEIEVQVGGKRLIRVRDNGRGMDEDDLLMCLERHATSKLHSDGDLERITTLGFRGEALPSIGAVSQMTITSATENGTGHMVTIAGGRLENLTPGPANRGTTVEVRNLFYNVPARKKFLKSESTESTHLLDVAQSYALSWPGLSLSFRDGARDVFGVESRHDFQTRVYRVLGRVAAESLRPFEYQAEGGLKFSGWLGGPERAGRTSGRLFVYVLGRPVKDRLLNRALAAGYGRLLASGFWPVAVVFIELDPSEVDVNVHPTKAEVRFRQPGYIFSALTEAVARTVGRGPVPAAAPKAVCGAYQPEESDRPVEPLVEFEVEKADGLWKAEGALSSPLDFAGPQDLGESPPWLELETLTLPLSKEMALSTEKETVVNTEPQGPSSAEEFLPEKLLFSRASSLRPELAATSNGLPNYNFEELRPLAQLYRSYILAQGEKGLYLIDQHAAHERLIYNQLKEKISSGLPSQALLFPDTRDLPPREVLAAEKLRPHLDRLGFELLPFGDNTFILKSAPAILGNRDPWPPLLEILGAASGNLATLEEAGLEEALASMANSWLYSLACRAAIKAGDKMTLETMEQLVRDMAVTPYGAFCPHGRPAIQLFERAEIEKRFDRR